ncbi:cytochrome P450 9b2-like [Teleopsis dalmanni]|uniref:cytochrome P450 9b2-like n=1 Tax=Teleopsis dalmanni TaxID=139649 RepID=UPI0018CCF36B|nr:cytochrome P450 9b2-like [Teleopsis dalmanni]
MAFLEIVVVASLALWLAYRWLTIYHDEFKKRNIPYEKPYPVVGNFGNVVMNKDSAQKTIIDFYKRNKMHKIVGFFNFRKPVYIINEPEMIKKICIKDFDNFPNHTPFINVDDDPLLSGMLTIMKDQRWKNMRNTLTPVFTTAKMRNMFPLMNECFSECIKNLKMQLPNGSCELEMKQFMTKLSNDIIASTAFGISTNSYKDPNNQFYNVGQSLTNFRGSEMIKFTISNVAPWILKYLGIKIFDQKKTDYFMRLVIDAMKYREKNNIVRPDMIQLLLEAKKESAQHWSDEDIVAQCFVFFFAAFENNTILICAASHELMSNPDVQQRLYEECLEIKEELQDQPLSYDIANKMKYMDMVLNETLRKWSIAALTDRVCSKDYKLTDEEDNFVFEFKVGDRVWFPISGLHMDEQHFENPEEFIPERFSDDNKGNIKPFTYIPFGAGPRNCIGNRYALMQAKAMLYYLVINCKLERSENTVKDIFNDIRGFGSSPRGGFWMRFVSRN